MSLLDIIEALAADDELLAKLGRVRLAIQAYQKRAVPVRLDHELPAA